MKRNELPCLALSALVMVCLPWLAVTFVQGSGGLAVCLILFFGIDPIMSVAAGLWAGNRMKKLWYLPLANAVLFLAGVWLNFEMGEPYFLIYAGGYLVIGYAVMLIKAVIQKK